MPTVRQIRATPELTIDTPLEPWSSINRTASSPRAAILTDPLAQNRGPGLKAVAFDLVVNPDFSCVPVAGQATDLFEAGEAKLAII
jgi:hypothetical protein